MLKRSLQLALATLILLTPLSAIAQDHGTGGTTEGVFAGSRGVVGTIRLSPPQANVNQAPPRDPVGGFALGLMAGVQLRGSASGQFGLTLAWFKQSTSNVGLEFEGAFTRGPDGEVYHGLVSMIFQSGSRATKMVPYLAVGGGMFHARENLRDSVAEALPGFGIEPTENSETGALIAFGFGVRYYMNEKLSFRADYREMRGITTSEGGFFDKLHSMRRIAGIMMLRF